MWEGMKKINNVTIPHAPIFRYLGDNISNERIISKRPLSILIPYG
tara:strand:+ start:630 stop:764 length:135 start_codon:yes stop_codon:yes gene_type:complete